MGIMITNRILYLHVQYVGHNMYVQHAHPFDRNTNPPSEHNHSGAELLLINALELIFFVGLIVFALFLFQRNLIRLHEEITYHFVYSSIKSGRSPPFFLS